LQELETVKTRFF